LQDAAIDIESDEDADIYDSLPDDIGNDALNASADSMPTVQLGATDMADENEFLMDSKGAQDGPVDLSDIDASLDESIKETAEESSDDKSESTEPGEPAADVEDFNEDEWDSEYASINNEEEQAPSVEDEPEIPIFAATESPAATDSAAETSVEPAPVQVIEKRKGSGFAIFLSLLALAGVGASFWLQLGPGIPGSSLESQLIQTVDRMNELQSDDRQLAMQIDELRQENDALKQQLNELALVVGNRTAAAKKKAARKARPVIKPSTPVKSAKPASAAPKVEGWVINLTSVSSAESAKQEIERLNKLGIEATSVRSEARGKIWYRIRVTGFATLEEAEAESALLSEKLGIKDIWVGKP